MRPSKPFEDYCWHVLQTAAEHVGIPVLAIMGPRKCQRHAKARHIAWHVIRQQTGTSYPLIAAAFGRTHGAIMRAKHYPEDVAAVIEAMVGIHVPPPLKRPAGALVKSRSVDKCPRCGGFQVHEDREQMVDADGAVGRIRKVRFCADCFVQWTRKAAK